MVIKYFTFKIRRSNKKTIPNLVSGFTLVEVLVATAIFAVISAGIAAGFVGILKMMDSIRIKGVMTNIANEQFEIARNLSYQDVGTVSGIPSGIILQSQTINRDNKVFLIETIVRNVDEIFDGTFNGSPKDLSPADMKLVEVVISCSSCSAGFSPISFTTKIAPKNLETASVNGALVIRVFDASGLPVSGANINIINNNVTPNINLNDQTDLSGMLTIVDAPPSVDGYQIIVTKEGYSTDRTYLVGDSSNPNPIKPNVIFYYRPYKYYRCFNYKQPMCSNFKF
jgi:prepilin-type N-terminal cleavage/methylation domain-containing protein